MSPFAQLALARRPVARNGLRAWDAADELLVGRLAGQFPASPEPSARVLIVGDTFGALAVAAAPRERVSWSDSAVAHLATLDNLRRNDAGSVDVMADAAQVRGPFDAVLWRVPRSLSLLRFQASVIQAVVEPATHVWAAGMDRHVPPRVAAHLGALGPVRMDPGVRKAHIFTVTPDPGAERIDPPPPVLVVEEGWGMELEGGPGVFSRERLDLGARVMLGALRQLPPAHTVADLCCGNAVLGIAAGIRLPSAALHFFDESHLAVASARVNVARNLSADRPPVTFHVDDGMHAYDGAPFDLIVCNPPFHQHGSTTDDVAWQMFTDARRHLGDDGQLWVVGNRHLGHHLALRRLFAECRQVAAHPKFVVLAASGRRP